VKPKKNETVDALFFMRKDGESIYLITLDSDNKLHISDEFTEAIKNKLNLTRKEFIENKINEFNIIPTSKDN